MKKTLFFHSTTKRAVAIRSTIVSFCLAMGNYPRLLLEVFIRKNFGHRYFTIADAIILAVTVSIIPVLSFIKYKLMFVIYASKFNINQEMPFFSWFDFAKSYLLWYVFVGYFLWVSYQRKKEIKVNISEFDFAKFSLYSGDFHPKLLKVKVPFYKQTTIRQLQIIVEPALFLAVSFVLIIFGQPLGWLLFICALIYSGYYAGAFAIGDSYVYDMIDNMIINKNLEKVFVHDATADDAQGFRTEVTKPADKNFRKELVDFMLEEEAVLAT